MEGVKSAGGECGEAGDSWAVTAAVGYLAQSLWALWPGAGTFSYDLIFLILLSASLRMKRMNCLKGQL